MRGVIDIQIGAISVGHRRRRTETIDRPLCLELSFSQPAMSHPSVKRPGWCWLVVTATGSEKEAERSQSPARSL
jgi:hypothetical protein